MSQVFRRLVNVWLLPAAVALPSHSLRSLFRPDKWQSWSLKVPSAKQQKGEVGGEGRETHLFSSWAAAAVLWARLVEILLGRNFTNVNRMSPGPLIKRRPLSASFGELTRSRGAGAGAGWDGRLRALFCVETILITEYAVDDGDDVVSAARRCCRWHEAHQTSSLSSSSAGENTVTKPSTAVRRSLEAQILTLILTLICINRERKREIVRKREGDRESPFKMTSMATRWQHSQTVRPELR